MTNKGKEKLYNLLTNKEAKEKLEREECNRITLSFYQYFDIDNPKQLRDDMYRVLSSFNVFGRIYLAHEGINAQINVPEDNFDKLRDYLYSYDALNGIRLNTALDDRISFWVLKIKVREKIVADGISDTTFNIKNRGSYVSPEQLNNMIENEKVVLVDMRNHYEYEVGHFENAIEIPSETFREQLPMVVKMMENKKDKNIVMYCTGGIRCEKASAWMLHNGFKNVFHLEGGIINYANVVKQNNLPNKFKGKNFVFDGRLGERIGSNIIAKCHQCGEPADNHVNCLNEGCHLLFIQCENCRVKFEGCCSKECKSIMQLPEEERKELRKGFNNGAKVFNKSKTKLKINEDS